MFLGVTGDCPVSPPHGCRGPVFPPSPENVETFQVYLLCDPPEDGFCQRFPHLSTSWLSAYERLHTWVVEVVVSDALENITFRWAIPEAPGGVSLWLLDTARDTQINILDPFSPEHAVPMDFDGTTTFLVCSFVLEEGQSIQSALEECPR